MGNEINITIGGIKELTDAVNRLTAALAGPGAGGQAPTGGTVQALLPTGQQQTGAAQAGYNFGQASPTIGAPVTQPQLQGTGPMPAGALVPTTAMAQGYTLEQLQVAAAGLSSMGKMQQILGLLQRFGIQAMTELPKERYGEFATALREAGAQI